MLDFIFLFLKGYFEFSFASYQERKHAYCEHPQIYFHFFPTLLSKILKSGIMILDKMRHHWLLSAALVTIQ
jgi:hypothetical protein